MLPFPKPIWLVGALQHNRLRHRAISSGRGKIFAAFFFLFQDDSLISDVAVKSDQLLEKGNPADSANHVRLLIRVPVKVTRLNVSNNGFVGD
jgi:hypothetical protein